MADSIVDPIATAAPDQPSFRLRHEAGLTSGDVIDLRAGRHQFGAARGQRTDRGTAPLIAFEIDVRADEAHLIPRAPAPDTSEGTDEVTGLTVDGRAIHEITRVDAGQVIGIGPDAFVLEDNGDGRGPMVPTAARRLPAVIVPPAPELPLRGSWEMPAALGFLLIALIAVAFLNLGLWPLLVPTGVLVAVAAWRQRCSKRDHDRELRSLESERLEHFRRDLLSAAKATAQHRRNAVILPKQVIAAARNGRLLPGGFPVAVALGSAGWHPDLELDGHLDRSMRDVIARHRLLPAVPVSLEPTETLLAIVGPRPAVLAVARHLLSATAQRDLPVRFLGSISPSHRSIWQALVAGSSTDPASMPLEIIDGGRPSERPIAGVELAGSAGDLCFAPDLLMSLQPNGVVTLAVPSTGTTTEGLMPIGISDERLRQLALFNAWRLTPPRLAARSTPQTRRELPERDRSDPVRGPVLIATGSLAEELGSLCTLSLDVLLAQPRTRLVVLDGPDRGLAGLRHLGPMVDYASTHEAVSALLDSVTRGHLAGRPILVVARSLGARLDRQGSQIATSPLGLRVQALLDAAESGALFLAAAEPPASTLPPVLVRRFPVRILPRGDHQVLLCPAGRQILQRRRLSPADVEIVVSAFRRRLDR